MLAKLLRMIMATLRSENIFDHCDNPERRELFLSFTEEKIEQNLTGFKAQGFHPLTA